MKLEARLSNRSVKYGEEKATNTLPQVNEFNGHPKLTKTKSVLPSLSFSTRISSSSNNSEDQRTMRDEEKEKGEEESSKKERCLSKFTSCRWVTGYVCCAARFAQVAIRQCIGMVVVCMTLHSGAGGKDASSSSSSSSVGGSSSSDGGGAGVSVSFSNKTAAVIIPGFEWSPEFEALILNAFNFGFLFSPIIGGHLAGRLGGKRVVLVALLVGSSVTVCLPFAALVSDIFVVLLRVVAGLFLGVVDPAIQALWAQWAPQTEKARLTTVSFTGVSLAGIATFFISAHLCSLPVQNGWPFIFYFFGGFSFLCTIPWVFLVYDSPEEHPRILDYEKALIAKGKKPETGNKKPQTPWRSMVRSGPVWAIVVSHATYSWVTSWMMSYLPKYLKERMEFDVKEDGLYSSLPYVGRMLTGFLCGTLSDKLLHSGLVTTGQCRKIFQVIGCTGCALCMLAVGFLDHSARAAAVLLLVLALSFQNLTSVAFRINHLDIAPRFAGVLMGISLTVAMTFSLTGPPVTAAILQHGEQEEWLGVFIIVASLNIIGGLVFFFLGSGDVQPWALPPATNADDSPIVSVVVLGSGGRPLGTPAKDTTDYCRHSIKKTEAGSSESAERKPVPAETIGTGMESDDERGERKSRISVPIPAQEKTSDAEGGRSSCSEDGSYEHDEDGSDSGAEDERRESSSSSKKITVAAKSHAKRALAHTVSMPVVPYMGAFNKHSLLRKRVSSTDVHQHSNDPKVRQNASAKSHLVTHPDAEDSPRR